jgi:hypothetical protein
MSGDWPPEWDDPEEEFPSGAEQQDTTGSAQMGDARLAEVTAYLASVPAPALPDAVAARISAALAAEATARAGDGVRAGDGTRAEAAAVEGGTGGGAAADSGRTLGTPPARARVRRRRSGARGDHGFRSIPLKAVTSVMAGLVVIAGIGYGISRAGGSMSSSSGPGYASAGSSAVAAPAAPEASASSSSAAAGGFLGISPVFTVSASGTKYQAATLAAQVRARLSTPAAGSSSRPSNVPGPSKTSSSSAAASSSQTASGTREPTTALRGCVLHLTGGQPPRLVDRATYQGAPAYVIASSNHVWVVGLGCTATNAELITSVALGS